MLKSLVGLRAIESVSKLYMLKFKSLIKFEFQAGKFGIVIPLRQKDLLERFFFHGFLVVFATGSNSYFHCINVKADEKNYHM